MKRKCNTLGYIHLRINIKNMYPAIVIINMYITCSTQRLRTALIRIELKQTI